MKSKLKKIIAREGLIILGIIATSLFLFFVSKYVFHEKVLTDFDVADADWVDSPQDETDAINMISDFRGRYPQYHDKFDQTSQNFII